MVEIDGWMTNAELDWLRDTASNRSLVLEIGTWKGRSTAALAEGCPGHVLTVDPFGGPLYEAPTYREAGALVTDIFAAATENLACFDNVTILRMTSAKAARLFGLFRDVRFDMIFIDGDHSEKAVRQDLALLTPLSNGLICGHDRDYFGVEAALEGLDVSEGPDSIWWLT